MLDALDALAALADAGTMTRAATRLRVSQSAVSKRIAQLTETVGVPLLEPEGRRVRLTAAGRTLLERARPLVAELRAAIADPAAGTGGRIAVGVSESVLASWGPRLLARVARELPEVEIELAAHRTPVAIERVRAGEYHLALCAGAAAGIGDLSQVELGHEPLLVVFCGGRTAPSLSGALPVITIEPGSASWRAMRPQIRRLRRAGLDVRVERTVQSFTSVVQLARAGFGHGLAPAGVVRALGVRRAAALPGPGVSRPISLLARAATLGRPAVAAWVEAVAARAASELPSAR